MSHPDVEFLNATVLEPHAGTMTPDQFVRIHAGAIHEIGHMHDRPRDSFDGQILDVRGRCLMPGLIDCHVHLLQGSADMRYLDSTSPTYATAVAAKEMRDTLHRGFTTVRDTCGADYGLATAVRDGHLVGPDIRIAGRSLSQTGGHGDNRRPEDHWHSCGCHLSSSVVCDGVSEVRRAARKELARGADHIKIMVSGGVGSPTDRVDSTQFSRDEIRAVVEEAEDAHRYVAAHAYPAAAINRALECGVRTIEHGNLLDDDSIRLLLERDAYLVPTLAAYHWMAKEGRKYGAPDTSLAKNADLLQEGMTALERAVAGGVNIAFGTDLLGPMRRHQLTEFAIRKGVQSNLQMIQSATSVAAALLGEQGRLGTIVDGARADLIVVDGDPLANIEVLMRPSDNQSVVMKSGIFYRNDLS